MDFNGAISVKECARNNIVKLYPALSPPLKNGGDFKIIVAEVCRAGS